MSCLIPPRTIEEFFGVINTCVSAYGGPDWVETALLGLLALVMVLLAGIGLVAVGRAR